MSKLRSEFFICQKFIDFYNGQARCVITYKLMQAFASWTRIYSNLKFTCSIRVFEALEIRTYDQGMSDVFPLNNGVDFSSGSRLLCVSENTADQLHIVL